MKFFPSQHECHTYAMFNDVINLATLDEEAWALPYDQLSLFVHNLACSGDGLLFSLFTMFHRVQHYHLYGITQEAAVRTFFINEGSHMKISHFFTFRTHYTGRWG